MTRHPKSSPTVKSGHQYRAESSRPTRPDFSTPGPGENPFPQLCRKNPGPFHRHPVTLTALRSFLTLLPDWPELSKGLNTILLAPHQDGVDGFHRPGLVALCAQPRHLSLLIDNPAYLEDHTPIFIRLAIPLESTSTGTLAHFTPHTRQVFFLLHVLLHELGHHHDRITTRSKTRPSRGESYAEHHAGLHADRIWTDYFKLFPPPPHA